MLMEGLDEIGITLELEKAIREFESKSGYRSSA
jgi:3-isopropylmalate dehydratase small subunit